MSSSGSNSSNLSPKIIKQKTPPVGSPAGLFGMPDPVATQCGYDECPFSSPGSSSSDLENTSEANNNDLDINNGKFEEDGEISAQKKENYCSEVVPGKRPLEVDPGDALNESQYKIVKIHEEKDNFDEDLDSRIALVKEEKKALEMKLSKIEEERNEIRKDRDLIKENNATLVKKYLTLSCNLREKVECPVCLEVPLCGPVHVCPDGHLVCSKCKSDNCPSCMCRMYDGKSLLAVDVIENIEHKCRNEECGALFSLSEYKTHKKSCPHRIVQCPAPRELCGKQMALRKVFDHVTSECVGSNHDIENKMKEERFPTSLTITDSKKIPLLDKSKRGVAFSSDGANFYLNFESGFGYAVFSIQLLGDALQCNDYQVNMAVHSCDDKKVKGKHVHKFFGEPLSIDIDQEKRKKSGLMVGTMQMENITVKDDDVWKFCLTFDIKK